MSGWLALLRQRPWTIRQQVQTEPKAMRMDLVWISSIFTPAGRDGGIPGLLYEGLAIANYSCALQCLVQESLQLVQETGHTGVWHENR
jgi:hypothetical protein